VLKTFITLITVEKVMIVMPAQSDCVCVCVCGGVCMGGGVLNQGPSLM